MNYTQIHPLILKQMKNILVLLLILIAVIPSKSQEINTDTIGIVIPEIFPSISADQKGIALQLYYQQTYTEGDFTFGPRVGITHYPLNSEWSHFYWQVIMEYKGLFFVPFWLRAYDKNIGYQIPTTLGYRAKTKIANIEVWGSYIYHYNSFDIHVIISPKKGLKLK